MTVNQIKAQFKRQLPTTLVDLHAQRLEFVNKAVKSREERNLGRRMITGIEGYSWIGTPWDWVMDELKFIAADTADVMKWKRAAASKLARDAKNFLPRIQEEWRCGETSERLVALKVSVLVKQAFYDQYLELKKFKEAADSTKKVRTGSRLQDIMRWVIVNHEFQYEIPEENYDKLFRRLYPNTVREIKSNNILKIPNLPSEISANAKPTDNEMFTVRPSSHHEMGQSPVSLYEAYEFNEDAPNIISLHDPFPDSLLAPVPMSPSDPLSSLDLSNLLDVPSCNYDEIVETPLNIITIPKPQIIKTEPVKRLEDEERRILEDLNEIFFSEPEPSTSEDSSKKETKKVKEDDILEFFDFEKQLEHKINRSDDEEFKEYINYLPECLDSTYYRMNHE